MKATVTTTLFLAIVAILFVNPNPAISKPCDKGKPATKLMSLNDMTKAIADIKTAIDAEKVAQNPPPATQPVVKKLTRLQKLERKLAQLLTMKAQMLKLAGQQAALRKALADKAKLEAEAKQAKETQQAAETQRLKTEQEKAAADAKEKAELINAKEKAEREAKTANDKLAAIAKADATRKARTQLAALQTELKSIEKASKAEPWAPEVNWVNLRERLSRVGEDMEKVEATLGERTIKPERAKWHALGILVSGRLTNPGPKPVKPSTSIFEKGWFWGVVGGAAVLVTTGVLVWVKYQRDNSKPLNITVNALNR